MDTSEKTGLSEELMALRVARSLEDGWYVNDSSLSFGIARGGHLDAVVLGGLQVSEKGELADWLGPARGTGGIGGAMHLATGARRVIVMMTHCAPDGQPRIVPTCDYPLTAAGCVTQIITDLAVIDVTPGGLLLREVAPGWTPRRSRPAPPCG